MTSSRRFKIDCQECSTKNIKCPNCNSELRADTKFSKWIRDLPYPNNGKKASCQNLDYIWFRFYDNWFITIEEKTNGKEYKTTNSDLSQLQSHGLVTRMLSFASGNEFDISFGSTKRVEEVHYKGHFLIVFSNTNPDDSVWIKINGNFHTKNELLLLLEKGILIDIKNEIKQCKTDDPHIEMSEKYKVLIPLVYVLEAL